MWNPDRLDKNGYPGISQDILGCPRTSWDIPGYPRMTFSSWDIPGHPRISGIKEPPEMHTSFIFFHV
jgi:hypothetical protein